LHKSQHIKETPVGGKAQRLALMSETDNPLFKRTNTMQYMDNYRPLTTEEREEREAKREEREAEMKLRNNRLAITVFQISWIMVFVCLIVVNWQLGFSPEWRPDGFQRPDTLLPTLATVALIASTVLAHFAWKAVERDNVKQFMQQWLLAIVLGVVFMLIMVTQFFATPASNNGEQFGFVYRLMIGYHWLHAIVIGFMMFQVWRLGRIGRYHAENTWAVEGTTKLWYFVLVAWLMFYVVLYMI
jgi:heme/copper-type cytochrome/quinol oxidase subunit 3